MVYRLVYVNLNDVFMFQGGMTYNCSYGAY